MQNSSGNVLFLILIAVALFAALSYAVTSSSRSSGGNVSSEKNNLTLSAKLQYLAQVQSTIQRMKLSNGCSNTDISFRGTQTSWNYNAFGPVVTAANAKCNVFEKEGGGLVRPKNPPNYLSTATGIKDIGTNNAELLWVEIIGEDDPGICTELFKSLYGQPLPTTTRSWSNTAFIGPVGSFTDYAVLDDPVVNGRHISCFNNLDYGGWEFYYVLIER